MFWYCGLCKNQWFSTFNHVCFSYYNWLAVIFLFAEFYHSTLTWSVREPQQQQQQTVFYYYVLCIYIMCLYTYTFSLMIFDARYIV